MIGFKWYSLINNESTLDKERMLEPFFSAVLMKHIKITPRRKPRKSNFLSHLLYGVACKVKDQKSSLPH